MALKAIILFLLSIFLQITCIAQPDFLLAEENLKSKIDQVVDTAIRAKAFPGCVIYASHQGKPILFEAYGYHTYDSMIAVSTDDLYDLASLTKTMGATLALMKLYEDSLIHLDDQLNKYVDRLWWRKIGKTTLRECLAHHAGLKGWIKYYEAIRKSSGKFKNKMISSKPSAEYPYRIAEGMYLHNDFYRHIKKMIRRADVKETKGYLYSGLFFYLVPEIVRNVSGVYYETYLDSMFYKPLGLSTITFNPLHKFPEERIVPTEIDTFFRQEPIHGKVHDEGAILMGGVSGNAGLFGNAEEVATLWQMLLNHGKFQDSAYLLPQTIDLFTTSQYPNANNRRGLGFDKPLLQYDSIKSSVAKDASYRSFGHTGFTGTLVWADPEYDLLFVFLSNRVYPSREQKAIYEMNIRPQIHQLFYDYLREKDKFELIRTLWEYPCWFK